MKSVIISRAPINWDCTLLINALAFDFNEKSKREYKALLREVEPWIPEDNNLERECAVEVIGRNLHIIAMETIVSHYTASYHESDIQESMEALRETVKELNKEGENAQYDEELLREKAKGVILHNLVYDDLAKMWNIVVTESHLVFFLKVVCAGKFGKDASKYLNDPKEFEKIRRKIIASEVGKRLRKTFKFKITVPKYRKYEKYIMQTFAQQDPFPKPRVPKIPHKGKVYN
ncbi:hypothetical protein [Candidatus Mycoplasma haematominutum]|uniref:Uncharacterized protein n=1 Tax=Candidatus Mycoplasma haematominutum 'Birmingham 1' TaxID=1116213 RepID=G8C3L4_9MOLU|nr:hypothetical protein [Candidatus Mycoplasma haematominutum]CCE66912.1 conserved haemoplasma hypothetical protein [Candidatus Mycoplasma haematominutum 'Birmingham 1']